MALGSAKSLIVWYNGRIKTHVLVTQHMGIAAERMVLMHPYFTSEDAERFWLLVNRSGECWTWKGRAFRGYGVFPASGTSYRAHRVAYILAHGDIPDKLCVLHRCDNPSCCRPDHLFLGTYADNSRDMCAKGRHWMQQNPERAHKVTPEMIVEIRKLPDEYDLSQNDIAKRLGISRETVSKVILRQGRFKNT